MPLLPQDRLVIYRVPHTHGKRRADSIFRLDVLFVVLTLFFFFLTINDRCTGELVLSRLLKMLPVQTEWKKKIITPGEGIMFTDGDEQTECVYHDHNDTH